MSFVLVWNAQNYVIPEPNDVGWGTNLDDFFRALPAGALQKSGGNFTLTADVDFGASFGLKSSVYKTRAADASTSGLIRLSNSDSIGWRDTSNGADLLLAVNGSNRLTFDGVELAAGGSGTVNSGTAGRMALYPSTATVVGDTYVQNSNDINVVIASHASLGATRTYTLPDTGANSSFVMTEGATALQMANKLLVATTDTNAFGDSGRIGFGTDTPEFRFHFKGDGDPLLYELTFAGDTFSSGIIGPVGNNIWWNKNGADGGGLAGDVAFMGTVLMNETIGHDEMAEIGIVLVDPDPASSTARMIFELRAAGTSWFTNGAIMSLDPIINGGINTGGTLRVGPGEELVSTLPAGGGVYVSSDTRSTGNISFGTQYTGSSYVYRGSDGHTAVIQASSTGAGLYFCVDQDLTQGQTFTPTARMSLHSNGSNPFMDVDADIYCNSHQIHDVADGIADSDAATVGQISSSSTGFSGEIRMYGGSSAPTGWLLCDGSAVSRTTYATLFGIIGTTFGTGDGSTTFNLPNFTDNVPMGKGANAVGATVGSATHAHSITHEHSTYITQRTNNQLAVGNTGNVGAATPTSQTVATFAGNGTTGTSDWNWQKTHTLDTANSGSASTIQPSLVISFIIKT
jgi:microcystin-dependent protein